MKWWSSIYVVYSCSNLSSRKEAELTIAGQTTNLNKDLFNFTGRTVEAVKGQRSKSGAYRVLIIEYLKSMPQRGVPQPGGPEFSGSGFSAGISRTSHYHTGAMGADLTS